jgi:hypothetical protein
MNQTTEQTSFLDQLHRSGRIAAFGTEHEKKVEGIAAAQDSIEPQGYDFEAMAKWARHYIYVNASFATALHIPNVIWSDIIRKQFDVKTMPKNAITNNNWMTSFLWKSGLVPIGKKYTVTSKIVNSHNNDVMLWTTPDRKAMVLNFLHGQEERVGAA